MHKLGYGSSALVLVLLLAAGCSTNDSIGTTVSGDALEQQLADIAVQSDGMVETLISGQLNSMPSVMGSTTEPAHGGPMMTEISFTRSHPCPLGGEVVVQATLRHSFDRDTGVMEASIQGTRTRTDCTFQADEFTLTVNSVDNFEAFRRRVNGVPDGLQTNSYSGELHVLRSDGEERSCSYSLTVVRDPEAHTVTVEGTICDTFFRRIGPWQPRFGG